MLAFELITSFLLASLVLSAYANSEPFNCSILAKCSTTEDIVYAVDKSQCYLFRNPCIFGTSMCQRRQNKEKELKIVSKYKCEEKCQNSCTEDYSPVCGEHNNTFKTFSNMCEFYRISCQNGQSYMLNNLGECVQP